MGCWILTGLRSGSSYLSYLLNATGKFDPYFGEWFNFGLWNLYIYFDKKYNYEQLSDKEFRYGLFKTCGLPSNAKVHYQHFKDILDNDFAYVESMLPDNKYIYLSREDNYAKAVSAYISVKTDVWHKSSNYELANKMIVNPQVRDISEPYIETDLNKDELLYWYKFVSEETTGWDEFIKDKDYIAVEYGDLINNTHHVVDDILKYLGISLSNAELKNIIDECTLFPSTHPQKQEFIEELRLMV